MKRSRPFFRKTAAALLLSLFLIPPPHACAESPRIGADLTLGYDSFIDRFTILEEDTSDVLQEIYLSLGTDLRLRGRGLKFDAGNSFKYGEQAISDYFIGSLSAGSAERLLFDLRHSLRMKFFREGSDYEFGNDYIQSNTSMRLTRRLRAGPRIAVKGRMEHIDYTERTYYDYDYLYLDGGIEAEAGSYFGNFVRLSGSIGHRSVPDTTALSYDRRIADVEFHIQPSAISLLEVTVSGDRREYSGTTRSSLWNVYSYSSLSFDPGGRARYALRVDSESYVYDDPSTTFFETHFVRAGFRSSIAVGSLVSVSAEPRFARLFCRDFPEERYREGSVILGMDVFGGSDYWLSLSWEPGRRDYLQDGNLIYSDFTLNRISVM
ncbi:MAG TPA: hypothetical protein VLA34_11225, partial [Candidatus Krumholzibacterium sp.]|nr:hypothetical protein [Candidatus Krumholzibacterium sp.]